MGVQIYFCFICILDKYSLLVPQFYLEQRVQTNKKHVPENCRHDRGQPLKYNLEWPTLTIVSDVFIKTTLKNNLECPGLTIVLDVFIKTKF